MTSQKAEDLRDEQIKRKANALKEKGKSFQKADKGITKTEKEEKQLARVLHFWGMLIKQRIEWGKWK